MTYILDTNIIIYYLKGMFPQIKDYLMHTAPDHIMIPSVVIAELEYGACLSSNYESNILGVRRFFAPFSVAAFDESAASLYGRIRSDLKKSGNIIGGNDMLIAATALSVGATIVTHNTDEFSRIDGLRICDWTE